MTRNIRLSDIYGVIYPYQEVRLTISFRSDKEDTSKLVYKTDGIEMATLIYQKRHWKAKVSSIEARENVLYIFAYQKR